MTLRHFEIFIAVAETGKMSAAAQQLYITQPSVSQAIRELEEHYHTLLFERLSRRLYITESGKRLLDYARRLMNQYTLLENSMMEFREMEQLRVGATITVGSSILSGVMNDLKLAHPTLRTYASVANTHIIEQRLLNSELDVALVEGVITHPDLITIPVVDDFLVLAMSADHPLAGRTEVSVRELQNYDFVMREEGSGTRRLFEDFLHANHIPCRVVWEVPGADSARKAILYNGCISCISVRLVEQELLDGRIHAIVSREGAWDRQFYLVYHKDKHFSAPMHTLQNMMDQYKRPEFLEKVTVGYLV